MNAHPNKFLDLLAHSPQNDAGCYIKASKLYLSPLIIIRHLQMLLKKVSPINFKEF